MVKVKARMERKPDGTWDVLVGDRVFVSGESYQVASNIVADLTLILHDPTGECGEVAESIRRQSNA